MRENREQKKYEYGNFSGSGGYNVSCSFSLSMIQSIIPEKKDQKQVLGLYYVASNKCKNRLQLLFQHET